MVEICFIFEFRGEFAEENCLLAFGNGGKNVQSMFAVPDHRYDFFAGPSRQAKGEAVVDPLSAERQGEHERVEYDQREEEFDRNMVKHIFGQKGRCSIEIEFQDDRLDTRADRKPNRTVYGLSIESVGKKKERDTGDINESEFPAFETFDAF